MAGETIKVYELARELNVKSSEITRFLQEEGHDIALTAASKALDTKTAALVRKKFGKKAAPKKEVKAENSAKSTATAKETQKKKKNSAKPANAAQDKKDTKAQEDKGEISPILAGAGSVQEGGVWDNGGFIGIGNVPDTPEITAEPENEKDTGSMEAQEMVSSPGTKKTEPADYSFTVPEPTERHKEPKRTRGFGFFSKKNKKTAEPAIQEETAEGTEDAENTVTDTDWDTQPDNTEGQADADASFVGVGSVPDSPAPDSQPDEKELELIPSARDEALINMQENITGSMPENTGFINGQGNLCSVIGCEKGDFAYHLASLLDQEKDGHGVLVIDNSTSQDLFGSVPKIDGSEYAWAGGITFASCRLLSPDVFGHFSYVIVYHGMTIDEKILAAGSHVIFLCDYTPESLKFMEACGEWLDGKEIVYMGKSTGKIKEHMFTKLANIHTEDIYIISEDSADRAGYLMFRHNGKHKLASMSHEYRDAVSGCAASITGTLKKRR